MKKLLLLGFALSSLAVYSNEKGNGGDVVVCDDGSVTMLDLFESRKLDRAWRRDTKFEWGTKEDNYKDLVNRIIARLGKYAPYQAEVYTERAKELFVDIDLFLEKKPTSPRDYDPRDYQNIAWEWDGELPDLDDSNHLIAMPSGCEIKQLAIQFFNQNDNYIYKKKYTINPRLLNRMDSLSLASFVLHEIIYRDYFSQSPNPTSVKTRLFNDFLTAQDWEKDHTVPFMVYFNELRKLSLLEKYKLIHFPKVGKEQETSLLLEMKRAEYNANENKIYVKVSSRVPDSVHKKLGFYKTNQSYGLDHSEWYIFSPRGYFNLRSVMFVRQIVIDGDSLELISLAVGGSRLDEGDGSYLYVPAEMVTSISIEEDNYGKMFKGKFHTSKELILSNLDLFSFLVEYALTYTSRTKFGNCDIRVDTDIFGVARTGKARLKNRITGKSQYYKNMNDFGLILKAGFCD